jgi:exopolysaccharide biosynthesis protein
MRKPFAWAIIYSLLLLSFTLFVALDTFVIPRSYAAVGDAAATDAPDAAVSPAVTAAPSAADAEVPAADTPVPSVQTVITDDSYSDANIRITIDEYREYNTNIFVANIVLSSAEYLKTAFAGDVYGKNIAESTSQIAEEQNAILAINGDYYGARNSGYVIRNGVIYRDLAFASGRQDLVILDDGSFRIVTEGAVTAAELLDAGAQQVLSFGPGLIQNGEIILSDSKDYGNANYNNPRTAIGVVGELHYVMVVADGRTGKSTGLTFEQLAAFMKDLGAITAYNLDGGGSSTMYFNGTVVNNPTADGKNFTERSVSDIVYIG